MPLAVVVVYVNFDVSLLQVWAGAICHCEAPGRVAQHTLVTLPGIVVNVARGRLVAHKNIESVLNGT